LARPFRYTFILGLVGAGTVLAAVGGWRFARASAPVSGPIVLISVDSLRADRLPIYGYDGADTPAIDALAADGVVFDRAYSHSPSSLASHASLLSGRLPVSNGVRGDAGYEIDRDEDLLAEVLRDRDYATAAIVSSYSLRRETGIAQGFSFFDDEFVEEPWSGRRLDLQRDGDDSRRIAEQWLETAGTERAFLFLHLNDPQRPDEDTASGGQRTYDERVEYADRVVGDFVDYLKSNQLYDQSTLILVSDHGQGLGDHGEQTHGLLLYDESLRVPMVIKPAASEFGGRRVADLVQLTDLMPTIVDLAKAPLPDDIDGVSLTALIDGSGQLRNRLVYAESMYARDHFGWSEIRAITDGRYRYISAPVDELYDLQTDPTQSENIVDAEPDVADRLRSALERIVENDTRAAPASVDARTRARLAALGVVGYRSVDATAQSPINPVDRAPFVEAFRQATDLVADGHWLPGVAALERLARSEPENPKLWHDLADMAMAAGRYELAGEAYRRVVTLRPEGPQTGDARLGSAMASFHLRRFDEAVRRARGVLAASREEKGQLVARAHELLARIALSRRDTATAFAHAREGHNADPRLPLMEYVEGRRQFDRGQYDEALTSFTAAIEALHDGRSEVMLEDLHVHAAETLAQIGQVDEAAARYAEEIQAFPTNLTARAALARLHHAEGRPDEAARALNDLIRFLPTPDAYNLAARLWTTFGAVQQAAAVRAEAGRLFAPSGPPRTTQE